MDWARIRSHVRGSQQSTTQTQASASVTTTMTTTMAAADCRLRRKRRRLLVPLRAAVPAVPGLGRVEQFFGSAVV